MNQHDDWSDDEFDPPSTDHRHIVVQIAESIAHNAGNVADIAVDSAAQLAAEPETFEGPISEDSAKLLWVRWAKLRDASTIAACRRARTANLLLAVVQKLAEIQELANVCDAEILQEQLEDLLNDPDLLQAFCDYARNDKYRPGTQIASAADILWAKRKCETLNPSTE